jgi:hypothetical protein
MAYRLLCDFALRVSRKDAKVREDAEQKDRAMSSKIPVGVLGATGAQGAALRGRPRPPKRNIGHDAGRPRRAAPTS